MSCFDASADAFLIDQLSLDFFPNDKIIFFPNLKSDGKQIRQPTEETLFIKKFLFEAAEAAVAA